MPHLVATIPDLQPNEISYKLELRFLRKIDIQLEGCWLWRSAKSRSDLQGFFWDGHKSISVSRFAWLRSHGSIPTGMHVLHKCDVRLCCRPDHLFLGTHGDNMRDMVAKGRARWQLNRTKLKLSNSVG